MIEILLTVGLYVCGNFIVLGIPVILVWLLMKTPLAEDRTLTMHNLDVGIKQARLRREAVQFDLNKARYNKVKRDTEVLESRQAKIDSEVAILELRLEEMRHKAGLDHPFNPTNY